jgi:hypothetical protein
LDGVCSTNSTTSLNHIPMRIFLLIFAVIIFSVNLSIGQIIMEPNSEKISVDAAKKLINEYDGELNKKFSVLPQLEVYDLRNNWVISIKVYANEAYLFTDKYGAVKKFEATRPRSVFEDYESTLGNFPHNKDSILKDLSHELDIGLDYNLGNRLYSDELTEKIKKYGMIKAREKLFLGLVTLMGESLILEFGGKWETETVKFPYPHLEPIIRTEKGLQEVYFIKMVSDFLWEEKDSDWFSMTVYLKSYFSN